MIATGNYQAASANRQIVTILAGDDYGVTEIIAGGGGPDGPHAYLVDQFPNVTLPPHFHTTDQFQVVLAGSGALGRNHDLAPITVHFARAKTAYGPITAGSSGLAYLTLRPRVEYGAHYLSDPKTVVDRLAPKFHATSNIFPDAAAEEGFLAGTHEVREVIEPDDRGLAAWSTRLPANATLALPKHPRGGDRFFVITSGTAVVRDELLPKWSCVWLTEDEDIQSIAAGQEGAGILTLQFPRFNDA